MNRSVLRAKFRRAGESSSGKDLASRLVTRLEPSGVASEAYRSLRTNLLYTFVDDHPKVILLTSPGPFEGKSTTCANLGVVLAQADKNTLILDCDLRRPTLHEFFGLSNMLGVTDVLVGDCDLQDVWYEPMEGLRLVTAGSIPTNPTEILGSRGFSTLLGSIREAFDYVLVDSAPVGLVSDSAVLATHGDGVLLVLDAQNTRKEAYRQS